MACRLRRRTPPSWGGQAGFRNPRLSGMGRCPRVNGNGLLIALSINHASSMRSRLQQAVIAVTRFPRHFLDNDFEANRSVRAARLRAEEGGVPADMNRYFRRDAGGRGERMAGALSAAASSVHWCAISSNRSRDRKSSVTSAARRHSCAWRSYVPSSCHPSNSHWTLGSPEPRNANNAFRGRAGQLIKIISVLKQFVSGRLIKNKTPLEGAGFCLHCVNRDYRDSLPLQRAIRQGSLGSYARAPTEQRCPKKIAEATGNPKIESRHTPL